MVKKIDHSCFQRVFGAHHHQARVLYQFLDDVRAVPQVIDGRSNIGATSLTHQGIVIVFEIGRQQALHGRPDEIHDRMKIAGLILHGPLQLLQRGFDRTATCMSEHDHQTRVELFCGKFDATDQRRGDDVAGHPYDKQIPQALIENDFDRYA